MELLLSGVVLMCAAVWSIWICSLRRKRDGAVWGSRDCALILGVFLMGSLVASGVGTQVMTATFSVPLGNELLGAMTGALVGGLIAVGCAVARGGLDGLGLTVIGTRKGWLWTLPGTVVLFTVVSMLWGVMLRALRPDAEPQALLVMISEQWPAPEVVFLVMYGVLFAPIIEEVIFRGFLLPPAVRLTGTAGGVALTAVLFGLLHISDPYAVPPLVLMGVLLATLRLQERSLWPAICLHTVNNAFAVWMSL